MRLHKSIKFIACTITSIHFQLFNCQMQPITRAFETFYNSLKIFRFCQLFSVNSLKGFILNGFHGHCYAAISSLDALIPASMSALIPHASYPRHSYLKATILKRYPSLPVAVTVVFPSGLSLIGLAAYQHIPLYFKRSFYKCPPEFLYCLLLFLPKISFNAVVLSP